MKRLAIRKRLATALLGAACLGLVSTSMARAEAKPATFTYTPASTVVAILPVIKKEDASEFIGTFVKAKDAPKDAPLQERHSLKDFFKPYPEVAKPGRK